LFSAVAVLAKLTSKNQLTLPKAATAAVGATEYFDVQTRDGVIVLTPVRIQRADAVRTKLAELALTDDDIERAVEWARLRVAESAAEYKTRPATKPRKTAKRKP
jgi:hypothetical protein